MELNNPFVLLEPKYFENEIYNVSWLLANGTYNGSNAIHPSAYQALLVENNTEIVIGSTVTLPIGTEYTKRGLSVKLSTDSDITDYDFVVNASDETFRLPIKVNLASGKAVVGNGMALGLTNGSQNFGIASSSGQHGYLLGMQNHYGEDVGYSVVSSIAASNAATGVTNDPTKSGIETSDANLYLYFYVGETVQNANLVNVGRIEEKLSNKVDITNTEWATSACMPDYSATIIPTSPFVAPCNGYLYAVFGSGQTLTMTITQPDGKSHTFDNNGTYANDMSNVIYPIAKGCTVVSNFPNVKYFYPCIGG